MVHSGYEASAVNDTFGSWRGLWATAKAALSTSYPDAAAAAELRELPARTAPLVNIGVATAKD